MLSDHGSITLMLLHILNRIYSQAGSMHSIHYWCDRQANTKKTHKKISIFPEKCNPDFRLLLSNNFTKILFKCTSFEAFFFTSNDTRFCCYVELSINSGSISALSAGMLLQRKAKFLCISCGFKLEGDKKSHACT